MHNTFTLEAHNCMQKKSNLTFLWREAKEEHGKLYLAALFSVLSTLLTYAPFLVGYFILNELLQPEPNYEHIKVWSIWTAVIVVVRFVLLGVSGTFSHIAAFSVLYQLRIKTINHLATLPLGYFSKKNSGELKKSINEDIEKIENSLAHQLPDFAAAIMAPLVIFIYLMTIDWKLSLILLIPLGLSFLLQIIMFKNFDSRMQNYHTHLENMNASFVEYIRGMAVFKAFNIAGSSFKKLRTAIEEYQLMWASINREQSPYYALFVVLTESALVFIIPVGGIRVLHGTLEPSAFLLIVVMSMTFLSSLKQLLDFGGTLAMTLEGVSRIQDIWLVPSQPRGAISIQSKEVRSLSFQNVSFKYDTKYVLKDISLQLKKGQKIAFVGPSGAGKTTAAELAARFFDAEEGEICINGQPIQTIAQHNLMNLISFVFQDTFLSEDTIYENIIMGQNYSIEQVEHVCRNAEIHDFIVSLPNGYQTKLGEAGIKVSGGQKQRIAIARALLKDAPIVILDEATSHSDIENERKIQRALDHLLKEKMTIIIAHRLHTIKEADIIYVFDEGEIIEYGAHAQLMNKQGRYYQMWQSYTKYEKGVSLNV